MLLDIPLLFWWLIVAILLAAVEVIIPGFFLIWLSAAAALTGLFAIFLPSIPGQAVVFALLSIAAVVFVRRQVELLSLSDDPFLNDRIGRLVGSVAVVVDPIVNGYGRVKIGDGPWLAEGPNAAAGTRVRIIGATGTILHVEPL